MDSLITAMCDGNEILWQILQRGPGSAPTKTTWLRVSFDQTNSFYNQDSLLVITCKILISSLASDNRSKDFEAIQCSR